MSLCIFLQRHIPRAHAPTYCTSATADPVVPWFPQKPSRAYCSPSACPSLALHSAATLRSSASSAPARARGSAPTACDKTEVLLSTPSCSPGPTPAMDACRVPHQPGRAEGWRVQAPLSHGIRFRNFLKRMSSRRGAWTHQPSARPGWCATGRARRGAEEHLGLVARGRRRATSARQSRPGREPQRCSRVQTQ